MDGAPSWRRRHVDMGARSQEALAKRAAKRGMTVEEYCAYERTKDKKKAEGPSAEQSSGKKRKASESGTAWMDATRSRLGDWTCSECKFVNFASRDECKQCNADAPSKEHRERVLEARKRAKEEKQRNADPSRAWSGSVGKQDQAHVDENRRLRELYAKDKSALTEEERTRAETLLARDERKRQKKAQRSPQPALRQKRDEWRQHRREQAAARVST